MAENTSLTQSAYAAGRGQVTLQKNQQNLAAVQGAVGILGYAAELGYNTYSKLRQSRRNIAMSDLSEATDNYFLGNSKYGTPGQLETIVSNSDSYEDYGTMFQEELDSWMNADTLAEKFNVSVDDAQYFIDETYNSYKDNFARMAEAQSLNTMKILNQITFGGAKMPDGSSTGGKLQVNALNLELSADEAMNGYKKLYAESHPEIWDPKGLYSLDNPQNQVYFYSTRAQAEGKQTIDGLITSTDMTQREIVDEGLKIYDSYMSEIDVSSDPNAEAMRIQNRDSLKATFESYAAGMASDAIKESESKGARFQNLYLERQETGVNVNSDTEFQKLITDSRLNPQNRYDEAQISQIKRATFGYDKDLTGKYQNADAIMSSPTLLADLSSYINTPVSTGVISDSGFDILGSDIDRTMDEINGVEVTSKYVGFVDKMQAEYNLSADETEYLIRSVNQYAATTNTYNSEQWKRYINQLAASPEISESQFTESLTKLRNAGLIDDETYSSYRGKKSGQNQDAINQVLNNLEWKITDMYGGTTGSERWNEITASGTFDRNIEEFVTSQIAQHGTIDSAKLQNFTNGLINVLKNDDVSDLVYKASSKIIQQFGYEPQTYFENQTLQELTQEYLTGTGSLAFNEDAVQAGQLYLQGNESTRTSKGLYDAVAKSLYGNDATYDEATKIQKEIIKRNGGIALAQYSQYETAVKTFSREGNDFRSVYVDGYGMAAMDDIGVLYMAQPDGSFGIGFISDPAKRKSFLNPSNTERNINLYADGINLEFYTPSMREISQDAANTQSDSNLERVTESIANAILPDTIIDNQQAMRDDTVAKYGEGTATQNARYEEIPPMSDPKFIGILRILMGGSNA